MKRRKVVNYLSNKVLLKEIHKSKTTYCEFDKPEYADYDLIIEKPITKLLKKEIKQAKINRANRLNENKGDELFSEGWTNKEIEKYIQENGINENDINDNELIIRQMTEDHIPNYEKPYAGKFIIAKFETNFPPFVHYKLINNVWTIVGKSHYYNGKFSIEHGKISRILGKSLLLLVERYGTRGNWRNYTYLEEMKGQALLRLSQIALRFNEKKSENPFAYYTSSMNNSFIYILNKEKQNSGINEELRQQIGMDVSFNQQADNDITNWNRNNSPELVVDND